MDEIERIPPVEGATVVGFDYAAADAALGVLRAAHAALGDAGGAALRLSDDAVVNWHGAHRAAFDEANVVAKSSIGDRLDGLQQIRAAVIAAVADANERQATNNRLVATASDA